MGGSKNQNASMARYHVISAQRFIALHEALAPSWRAAPCFTPSARTWYCLCYVLSYEMPPDTRPIRRCLSRMFGVSALQSTAGKLRASDMQSLLPSRYSIGETTSTGSTSALNARRPQISIRLEDSSLPYEIVNPIWQRRCSITSLDPI